MSNPLKVNGQQGFWILQDLKLLVTYSTSKLGDDSKTGSHVEASLPVAALQEGDLQGLERVKQPDVGAALVLQVQVEDEAHEAGLEAEGAVVVPR